MKTLALKIARVQLRDAARSRWLIGWTLGLCAVTEALIRFAGTGGQTILALVTVSLMLVPLVALVLATVALYNAREFTELLLAQPVRRGALFAGLYLGLAVPLAGGFLLGVGAPFALRGGAAAGERGALAALLTVGVVLTLVCTALAFVIALASEDRLRGLGVALGAWLGFGVVYDGLVLVAIALFGSYPLERPLIALTLLNPIDLARVLLLLELDVSALMGYTGAVFQRFFGGAGGAVVASTALAAWLVVPVTLALRRFRRKDF